MKRVTFSVLFSLSLLSANAQQPDSLKQKHLAHLKKELAITDAKAKQVADVQDDYKTKAKALAADSKLSQEEKRTKFDALIADKNAKLAKLLNEQQLNKIVLSSEKKKTASKN